jgi:hypothetical protein
LKKRHHFAAFHRWEAATPGLDKLRVILVSGGGVYDEISVADVRGGVTLANFHTQVLDRVSQGGKMEVGARNLVSAVPENASDGGHMNAADSYEVDVMGDRRDCYRT